MAARILIIEDNQANIELLTFLLTAFGHQPLVAVDGEQGVAMALAERPDMILCDLHLPRLDGHGVLAALKADPVTRDIPVLAASAMPVNDNCAALRRAGFTGCLPKSLEPDQLLPVLEHFLPLALRSGQEPATYGDAAAGAAPAAASGGMPRRGHVLLLDAAPENAGLVSSILEPCGYQVTAASNPAQAAALAGRDFDLVLCDLGLNEAGRTAFLSDALELLPDLPVVLIRPGHDDDLPALAAGRVPAPQLLSHPLEPQQLVSAIESSLAQ